MKTIKYTSICFVSIVLLLISLLGCSKIGEYYVGLNLQPNMNENDYKPGLNVFGVMKVGPSLDTLNHYFEVQQLFHLIGSYDSTAIADAKIQLIRTMPNGQEQVYYPQHQNNGLYADSSIITAPADRWFYSCKLDTMEVSSQCIIPNTPQLINNAAFTAENEIQLTIKNDTTAYLYQVYILNSSNISIAKKIPQKGVNTTFTLKPNWPIREGKNLIYIFAYDRNLQDYISTSNVFFKPNAYRPRFTTVNGGFGTFGAVSSNLFVLE